MAAKTTIKVAITNSAAKDDSFSGDNLDWLSEDGSLAGSLNVLGNDPGSASLWSVSSTEPTGTGNIGQEAAGSEDSFNVNFNGQSYTGKLIMNADGTVGFDLTSMLGVIGELAEGEVVSTTFYYTARMANGVLSTAKVTVEITGENDGPTLSATAQAYTDTQVYDDFSSVGGQLAGHDVDHGAKLTYGLAQGQNGESPYGTFTVDAAGNWNFVPDDAAINALVSPLELNFNVYVTDEHGARADNVVKITLNGVDDAAVITGDVTGSVTEASGIANGTAGVLTAVGDLDATDVDSSAAFAEQNDVGKSYGHFSINMDGEWSYTVDDENAAVQALNIGGELIETVTVETADGTKQQIGIKILGANDAAVITGNVTGSVTEASGFLNAVPGVPTATGDLDAADVDSSAAFVEQNNAEKTYGHFSIDADGAWSYTVDNENATVQALNDGDTLSDIVTVTTADGTTQQVQITINGVNDAALLSSAVENLSETDAAISISASGVLTISDVDSPEIFKTQTDTPGNYGRFSIAADGAWTYVADSAHNEFVAGQIYTEHFPVRSSDGTFTSVTINILGTNDAALLSPAAVTLTETDSAADVGASGMLAISDVDSAETFQAQADVVGNYGKFSIAADGAWTYVSDSAHDEFAAGQTYSDSFAVLAADGTPTSVSVKIFGTNDAAVIAGDSSGTIVEDALPAAISGNLDADDVDGPDDAFVAVAAPSSTSYGSYTVDAAGHWTYQLDNSNPTVNALNNGGSLSDNFTVFTTDGASQVVSIAIQGHSDAIVVAPVYDGAGPDDHDADVGSAAQNVLLVNGTNAGETLTGDTSSNDKDIINGFGGDDIINAGDATDQVYGGTGNDIINGGSHADSLYGQSGIDTIHGDEHVDQIFGGSGVDFLFGDLGDDTINGGSGNDSINGGGGNDIIVGGYGADSLNGGADNDTFRYLSVLDTGDIIADFNQNGNDLIDLSAIDANGAAAGDPAFSFGGTTATANGVWYAVNSGNATVYVDTDGDVGTAEMAIQLLGVTSLSGEAGVDFNF